MSGLTHQHQSTRDKKVDNVPEQGGKPEVDHVDTADKLDMLGFDGPLADQQQSEGAGERGHAVQQVDGNGEPSLSSAGRAVGQVRTRTAPQTSAEATPTPCFLWRLCSPIKPACRESTLQ